MITPRVLLPVVLVIGLLQHVGAAGMWMGSMPIQGNSGLLERQLNCGTGSTACGNFGCLPTGRCCNPDGGGGGWTCRADELCYTVSQTVDCYATSLQTAAPTSARPCYDYTASANCPLFTDCFQCISTAYPYCFTRSAASSDDIWIVCNAAGGSDPIPTGTITSFTTTSSSNGPSSTTRSSATFTTSLSPTITPGPSFTSTPVPTTGGGAAISTGAIAGIAIASFVALSVIGILAFLLYRKGKNNSQPQPQPQPQPLMNDMDNNYNYAAKPDQIELSADPMHPQMLPYTVPQELDSYQTKHIPTSGSGPSELG